MLSLKVEELVQWLNSTDSSELLNSSNSTVSYQTKSPASHIGKTITGVSTDTRTLIKGDLFIAIEGEQLDGHQYLKEAAAKGAVAALVNQHNRAVAEAAKEIPFPLLKVDNTVQSLGKLAQHYRRQFNIPLAAVTGSCGKTSVKEMLASVLMSEGPALATRGNLNTEIGVPLTLMRLNANHQSAVIEMGARKQGDIKYLMNIAEPTVTLITNAGVAHLGIFGSERGVAEAKGEIYAYLNSKGTAIINLDDPHADYWKSLLKGQQHITFGFNNKADVSCASIEQTAMGSVFKTRTPMGEIQIHLSSPGKHSISNALAVIAAAIAMNISNENIKEGLEAFIPVVGRLQTKMGKNGVRVIDDTYNANPVSVKAALEVLAAYPQTIFVMGDMLELGNDSEKLHQSIGEEAKRLGVKYMLGIGPLTRHAILAFGGDALHFENKNSLIEALMSKIGSNEITVLVKGSRGMRMEEVVQALM